MLALLKKELHYFFSTPIGLVFLACFLIFSSLFLWILEGSFNILDSGFASLSPFFDFVPWIFIFLIPAISMHSFAEERKQGTLELLLIKPTRILSLVFGKFLGILCIGLIAVLPTLLYVIIVYQLAEPLGNIDTGSIIGSYIALFLLLSSYTSIGIFASSLTKNQTIALIISILGCFFFYIGLEYIPYLKETIAWDVIGFNYHYSRISEGVLDTRDILYFGFVSLLFTLATALILQPSFFYSKKNISLLLVSLLLFIGGSYNYKRFDLTEDQRFSLAAVSEETLSFIDSPVHIDILLAGNLPAEFKKLQRETQQLLTSFSSKNPLLKFNTVNPLEPIELRSQNLAQLKKIGIIPAEVSTQFEGALKKEIVLPWAVVYYKNKTLKVPLLKNKLGATTQQRTTESIQNLEYAFTNTLKLATQKENQKIAILKGNHQLKDVYLLDFLRSLQQKYTVRPVLIEENPKQPIESLNKLLDFDLVINAKPTKSFSEAQKLILDQHLMNGNRQLHLIDLVNAEKDSVFSNSDLKTLAWINDLKLNDYFFAYGVRINPLLIDDYYSAPIVLAKGKGENTQYTPYNWGYSPLATGKNSIVSKNIDPVKFNFCSPIELLKNETMKTTLLQSSPLTHLRGVPSELNLNRITASKPKEYYASGVQNLAVLLEGKLKSVYKNRILPFDYAAYLTDSNNSKLVVISDGDVIKNEASKGNPLPLGFDPVAKRQYGNKDFLLNTVNYLLKEEDLIALKAKQLHIPSLDYTKVSSQKRLWRWLTILIPLTFIILIYLIFFGYRRYKFTKPLQQNTISKVKS